MIRPANFSESWAPRGKPRCDGFGHESCFLPTGEEKIMLLTIGLILLVLWGLGLFAFHVTGGLIHILVVLALISFIFHVVRGRRIA